MTPEVVASAPYWDEALGRLRDRISPQNFDMWLRPIECTAFDGHVIRLRAPNTFIRRWFENNFLEVVRSEVCTLNVQIGLRSDLPLTNRMIFRSSEFLLIHHRS